MRFAGATYPADKVAQQSLLFSDNEAAGEGGDQAGVAASMRGEEPGAKHHRRLLSTASRPSHFTPITSGFVGLAPAARPA